MPPAPNRTPVHFFIYLMAAGCAYDIIRVLKIEIAVVPIQAEIFVEVLACGFLMGSQSQLDYLPEKQTDFVFTMIGEEFGLVGNLFILGLYLALSLSILRISYLVRSRFSQLTCMGISMMLFFYVFVNVAMVSGMLPVVGAPLPLISYGGTSMLTVFIGLGIVTSILIHDRQED